MTVSVLLICSGEILTCNFSYTRRMVLREGSENSVAGGGNAAGRRNAKDAALPGMAGPVVGRAATAEDGRAVPCPGWVEGIRFEAGMVASAACDTLQISVGNDNGGGHSRDYGERGLGTVFHDRVVPYIVIAPGYIRIWVLQRLIGGEKILMPNEELKY